MQNKKTIDCTAFTGFSRLASGDLLRVAASVKQAIDAGETEPLLIFNDQTSAVIELDLRGSMENVLARIAEAEPTEPPAARRRGRPKLGVVAREVTLLPRHWDWLRAQPGGASVTLRKLVEAARRSGADDKSSRQKQNVVYDFMHAIAGDLPGFEEASRALFAGDFRRLQDECIQEWPDDIVAHIKKLLS